MNRLKRTALLAGFVCAVIGSVIGWYLAFSVGHGQHVPLPVVAILAIVFGLGGYRIARGKAPSKA